MVSLFLYCTDTTNLLSLFGDGGRAIHSRYGEHKAFFPSIFFFVQKASVKIEKYIVILEGLICSHTQVYIWKISHVWRVHLFLELISKRLKTNARPSSTYQAPENLQCRSFHHMHHNLHNLRRCCIHLRRRRHRLYHQLERMCQEPQILPMQQPRPQKWSS